MYKNILLPLDGSTLAEQSISPTIELAKIFGSKIILLQIGEVFPLLKEDRDAEEKLMKERAGNYLDPIKKKLEEEGLSVDIAIKTGKADLEICLFAGRYDIDLVVMSTHGLGGITRWALGSVSDKVVRHSPKPVLLLRPVLENPLKDKVILVVDDEEDVLETVEEELDMCKIHKASDYKTACNKLKIGVFDIVILDIMGVNGFELLKESVSRGFPTVMLTAHALTQEALEESMKFGAVSFLPKERMSQLQDFLADVIECGGKPAWQKLFDRLGSYFRKRFGSGWKEQEILLKNFEEAVIKGEK